MAEPIKAVDEVVIFTSPRKPFMTVIVVADQWKEVSTPAGSKLIQVHGKTAQFDGGVFKTSDPEVIDYLENTYKDRRWPIISSRQLADLGKKHNIR